MDGKPEEGQSNEHRPGELRAEASRFDAFRLARDRGTLHGTICTTGMARLAQCIVADAGPLSWRIEGGSDAAGRPALTVAIAGDVMLECQRCLRPVVSPVALRTMTILAHSDAEGDALDEASEHEVMVVDGLLHAETVIEDELLLSLPFAPMHPTGECATPPSEGAVGQ
jgi:uncharacterized protein